MDDDEEEFYDASSGEEDDGTSGRDRSNGSRPSLPTAPSEGEAVGAAQKPAFLQNDHAVSSPAAVQPSETGASGAAAGPAAPTLSQLGADASSSTSDVREMAGGESAIGDAQEDVGPETTSLGESAAEGSERDGEGGLSRAPPTPTMTSSTAAGNGAETASALESGQALPPSSAGELVAVFFFFFFFAETCHLFRALAASLARSHTRLPITARTTTIPSPGRR
jgi:hypothetical protein